jgi:hypothetical protein
LNRYVCVGVRRWRQCVLLWFCFGGVGCPIADDAQKKTIQFYRGICKCFSYVRISIESLKRSTCSVSRQPSEQTSPNSNVTSRGGRHLTITTSGQISELSCLSAVLAGRILMFVTQLFVTPGGSGRLLQAQTHNHLHLSPSPIVRNYDILASSTYSLLLVPWWP